MEYTEGDWKVQSDGETICREGARVARAYDPEHPERATPTTRANAHLIAASPDMYEALKKANRWISMRANPRDRADHALADEIDQTLAKADGK